MIMQKTVMKKNQTHTRTILMKEMQIIKMSQQSTMYTDRNGTMQLKALLPRAGR